MYERKEVDEEIRGVEVDLFRFIDNDLTEGLEMIKHWEIVLAGLERQCEGLEWNDHTNLYSTFVRNFAALFKKLKRKADENNTYGARKYCTALRQAIDGAWTARALSRRDDIVKHALPPLDNFMDFLADRYEREKEEEEKKKKKEEKKKNGEQKKKKGEEKEKEKEGK